MAQISEEELKKILELVNTVPQEYRLKCFELLLSHALRGEALPPSPPIPPSPPSPEAGAPKKPFGLAIDVKAFLSQYRISESLIWKCFHAEGNEIRPIYQLKAHKKAKAQIEHALMMALESALKTGQFQVSPEELRTRCTDHKCYDSANFMKNLKSNKTLFKAIEGDEPLLLSPEGKSELAELIEGLKNGDE